MSTISDMIMAEQEKGFGRVMCDVGGKERINFPVRKTRNKDLQKTLLKIYLSLSSKELGGKYFNNQTTISVSVGSLDTELNEKYKGFQAGYFFTHFLHNMEKFSDWMYIDDDQAVSILNGFGNNECLLVSVTLNGNDLDVVLDFQRYPKQTVIIQNEKFIITNGYTFNDEVINSFLPKSPKEISDPVCELNCCICFDDFEKVSYKCRTCKEGIVCKGCCKKMKGVKRCPICRS